MSCGLLLTHMLSLIVSLLGLSPSTNLYLSKATAHCANATLEPCSYTLYINHDTDNPGVLPVLRNGFLSGKDSSFLEYNVGYYLYGGGTALANAVVLALARALAVS